MPSELCTLTNAFVNVCDVAALRDREEDQYDTVQHEEPTVHFSAIGLPLVRDRPNHRVGFEGGHRVASVAGQDREGPPGVTPVEWQSNTRE